MRRARVHGRERPERECLPAPLDLPLLPPEIASLSGHMRLDHLLQAHAYATSAERLPPRSLTLELRQVRLSVARRGRTCSL